MLLNGSHWQTHSEVWVGGRPVQRRVTLFTCRRLCSVFVVGSRRGQPSPNVYSLALVTGFRARARCSPQSGGGAVCVYRRSRGGALCTRARRLGWWAPLVIPSARRGGGVRVGRRGKNVSHVHLCRQKRICRALIHAHAPAASPGRSGSGRGRGLWHWSPVEPRPAEGGDVPS